MHRSGLLSTLAVAVLFAACSAPEPTEMSPRTLSEPPMAEARPTTLEKHGDVRVDDYYWLRERDDPEVVRYLEAENAYTEAAMADTTST